MFTLKTSLQPKGDQPQAIESLVEGYKKGVNEQVLLGVTGSGKTFTSAHVIAQLNKPVLVMAPNKTLAAQLFSEFKELFPENAVEFFISYYDYYQPEAYVPSTNTYIEKDASVNDQIDRMRHSATSALMSRNDVIIVASVSCIYNLGSPEEYGHQCLSCSVGSVMTVDDLLASLVGIHYTRQELFLERGTFRVTGDVVEVFASNQSKYACRIDLWGGAVQGISLIDPYSGTAVSECDHVKIFPVTHYVTSTERFQKGVASIEAELKEWHGLLMDEGKEETANRIWERTMFDLEMLKQTGMCRGIENYSRHFDGRQPGQAPFSLLDYFPDDSIVFIDESHITVPQIRGMYAGDKSRKQTLVDFGFRLPSAMDNRPLNFEEFMERVHQVLYISATPGTYELTQCEGVVTEQIIRPTGLVDPAVCMKPAAGQVKDLLEEVKQVVSDKGRVLITTLTKKMAEELCEYMADMDYKAAYIHSDIKALQRTDILKQLRQGEIDVLIGVNLLREGLDLPEVSLVAVLDADKEGFLRSETSLIQICGRAARNIDGRVILYCDRETRSINAAVQEMARRRVLQIEFNKKHGIQPVSVAKKIGLTPLEMYKVEWNEVDGSVSYVADESQHGAYGVDIRKMKQDMRKAAASYDFARAARLRDRIQQLELKEITR